MAARKTRSRKSKGPLSGLKGAARSVLSKGGTVSAPSAPPIARGAPLQTQASVSRKATALAPSKPRRPRKPRGTRKG